MKWREHHYLYRVSCRRHHEILLESSYYPNINILFCPLCSWRAEDNLMIESRDITRFSEWEQVV